MRGSQLMQPGIPVAWTLVWKAGSPNAMTSNGKARLHHRRLAVGYRYTQILQRDIFRHHEQEAEALLLFVRGETG